MNAINGWVRAPSSPDMLPFDDIPPPIMAAIRALDAAAHPFLAGIIAACNSDLPREEIVEKIEAVSRAAGQIVWLLREVAP